MKRVIKVFGPPGTGKTTFLLRQAISLWLGKECHVGTFPKVDYKSMAYLAFNRSAAEHAKTKFTERLLRRKMEDTKAGMKWWTTVHAAARRSLNFPTWKIISGTHNTANTGEGFDRNRHIVNMHSLSEARMCDPNDVWQDEGEGALRQGNYNAFELYLQKIAELEKKGMRTQNGVIREYLKQPAPLPVTFGFIDEAQDLSKLQWAAAHHMLANCEVVFVAGDDDQGINRSIGAEPEIFMDLPCYDQIVLEKSHRVPRNIGLMANKVIRKCSRRVPKTFDWADGWGEVKFVGGNFFDYVDPNEETLVLARNRKDVTTLVSKLYDMGWAARKYGHTPLGTSEGKRYTSALEVLATGVISRPKYSHLWRESPVLQRAVNNSQWNEEGRISVDPSWGWKSPLDLLSGKVYEEIHDLVRKAKSLKPTLINVMTTHASKGLEASHVILMTDCSPMVFKQLNNDDEIRLAYVALTRTKKRLTIVAPQYSPRFITHLTELEGLIR